MKTDLSKKKRSRDGGEDHAESAVSHHRKRKNIIKNNKPFHYLNLDNIKNENNVNCSSSFTMNAGEGCSKNIFSKNEEEREEEEQVNNEDDEKSVFDFPWSKESGGGIVNIFEEGDYCYSYNNIIGYNLFCEDGSTSIDVLAEPSSNKNIIFLPQQENCDILGESIDYHEALISSTFEVDELEGSDWINNLEQTNNATITTSATAAN